MSADELKAAAEKMIRAKDLYSHGSRNFLVKNYAEAADELSEVCALYEELYGELSDELGMPYLLYAKSLIALAMDENKVIDVPDEEDDDDDDEDDDAEEDAVESAKPSADVAAPSSSKNGAKLAPIKEKKVAEAQNAADKKSDEAVSSTAADEENGAEAAKKKAEEAQVSSSADADAATVTAAAKPKTTPAVADGEKPSTSNGGDSENGDQAAVAEGGEAGEEEDENASSLQLAWEILELAARIFSRQGMGGLPNLAEVQTELANIEFENNIVDEARKDYAKALQIYKELPTNYRRAMAEIHYKIGLTHLMQNQMKEGAAALKEACHLIEGEIGEIKAKPEPSDKDKNNIKDMEETKQEIWAKITEIEEAQAQNLAEVRAALDSYIKPIGADGADGARPSSSAAVSTNSNTAAAGTACSSSSATAKAAASSSTTSPTAITSSSAAASSAAACSSSSKPTDISHLIKRKKPEEPSSEAEAASASPAKRPAV